MFLCNIQTLQNKYSATYRKIPYNETREHLKQRHQEYANLGRLILESCWIYGTDITATLKASYYHGINCQLLFLKFVATLTGPTSTSTTKTVAVNFCSGNGIFLSSFLCKEIETGIKCIDFNIFCTLFPNVETIVIDLMHRTGTPIKYVKINEKYIEYISKQLPLNIILK